VYLKLLLSAAEQTRKGNFYSLLLLLLMLRVKAENHSLEPFSRMTGCM
jgi:hypothetical protein